MCLICGKGEQEVLSSLIEPLKGRQFPPGSPASMLPVCTHTQWLPRWGRQGSALWRLSIFPGWVGGNKHLNRWKCLLSIPALPLTYTKIRTGSDTPSLGAWEGLSHEDGKDDWQDENLEDQSLDLSLGIDRHVHMCTCAYMCSHSYSLHFLWGPGSRTLWIARHILYH